MQETWRTAVLTILAENEPGVLSRIAGLITGRGYNIDSLAVAAVGAGLARFTIVTAGTDMAIEQLQAQLRRLVPVHAVDELRDATRRLARELGLFKVIAEGPVALSAREVAARHGARLLTPAEEVLVFELTGEPCDLDALARALQAFGLVESARSGLTALSLSAQGIAA